MKPKETRKYPFINVYIYCGFIKKISGKMHSFRRDKRQSVIGGD